MAPLFPYEANCLMKRYVRGWFRDPLKVRLYVSRGIGTSMAPVRFGSRPEVAVFTMWA